jgi:FkbM family methyltransferase
MNLNIQDLIQETILLENVWDPLLTNFVTTNLRRDGVFVDIGANAGYFSLLASQCVGSGGKVLAIEPNPIVAEQLKRNIARNNLANVIVAETACVDTTETTSLTLYLYGVSNSGRASVSRSNAESLESVQVRATTADRLIRERDLQDVTLIKIDVEGAELMVLKGMQETIKRFKPTIVLELEDDLLKSFATTTEEVIRFLSEFGYVTLSLGGHANYISRPAAVAPPQD